MKIYTKKGDKGKTSLLGGTRVSKHHVRIEAYGTVDELNSWLGMLHDQDAAAPYRKFLNDIQDRLFTIGSVLASDPEKNSFKLPEIGQEDIDVLEKSIDELETDMPALKNFILPGGHPASSTAQVCRTVCRRAERRIVHLDELQPVNPLILGYLNRLSDWLFVFARKMLHATGSEEIIWQPQKKGEDGK